MDRLIYTSMTGANHTLHQQATVAQNLANVSTNGYRAEKMPSEPFQYMGMVHPRELL